MPEFHRKRWPCIIYYALTIVIIGIGFIYSGGLCMADNPVYRSSAILEMRQPSQQRFAASEGLIPVQKSWDIEIAVLNLKSRSMAELIMEQVYLLENLNKKKDEKERRILIDKIREGIEINISSPGIIEFSATYDDPVICQKIVNRLMRFLIKDELMHRDKESEANITWIDNELKYFNKNLSRNKEIINKFREDNQGIICDIESGYSLNPDSNISALGIVAKHSEKYSQDLLHLGIEYKALKAEEKVIEEELSKIDKMVVEENQPKTGKVISITGSGSPVYKELQLDLIRLRRKMAGIEARIDAIKTLEKTVELKLEEMPEKEIEYARLRKEYNNNMDIHDKLQKMREKVCFLRRLELEERGTHFMIIEAAEIPREPYIPD